VIEQVHWSSCKVHVVLKISMQLELSRQVFEKKYSYVQFYENPSRGSGVVLCRRTDGQTQQRA